MGNYFSKTETERCIEGLRGFDKTHALIITRANESFEVLKMGDVYYLEPNIGGLANFIDCLLMEAFKWDNIRNCPSTYELREKIGSYWKVDFEAVAEHYFQNYLQVRINTPVIASEVA